MERPTRAVAFDDQEIEAGVAAYVDALRQMSIPRLRQAYPGITVAEVRRWEGVFARVREGEAMRVRYHFERRPVFRGDVADVVFVATLTYVDRTGNNQTAPQPLRAEFERRGARWVLVRVLGLS